MAFCSRCGVSIEGRFCSACGYDNQPKEKVQTVKDTIDQLYSLRAGMSLVSVQIDDTRRKKASGDAIISSEQNKIDSINERIKSLSLELSEKEYALETSEFNKNTNKLGQLYAKKEELRKQKEKDQRSVTISRYGAVIAKIVGVIAIIAASVIGLWFIVGLLVTLAGEIVKSFQIPSFFEIGDEGFIVIGVGIACAVAGGILIKVGSKKTSSKLANEYMDCEVEINSEKNFQIACEQYVHQIPQLQEKIDKLNLETNEKVLKLSEKKVAHENEIAYYNKCANETYNALVNEYSSILDARDWGNLDLVIYYLETRRAISVREALQLVDRQHQNDAIVEALKVATAQISETIILSSEILSKTVIGCTEIIAKQLTEVCGRMNVIQVNQEIANAYLRNISSETALNNAMIKKAKTTSEEMMQDIKQMRIYADNREVRRRNSIG